MDSEKNLLLLNDYYILQITALWLGGEQDSRRWKLPGFIFSSSCILIVVCRCNFYQCVIGLYIFSQFRALSDQLYRSPEHHSAVREQVVNQVGILYQEKE